MTLETAEALGNFDSPQWQPYHSHAVKRFLQDHQNEVCVMDLGAGHALYEGTYLDEMHVVFAPYDVILLIPSPAEPAAPPHQRLFLPALLADTNVRILAAYHEHRIVAGAIANRTDGVVGLSNVFVPVQSAGTFWAGCVAAVLNIFPDLPLVGYETGEALSQTEALGFEVVQPLRVWQTVMQPI